MKTKTPLFIIAALFFVLVAQAQETNKENTGNKNHVYGYAGTTLVCWSTGAFYERDINYLKQSTLYARAGIGLYAFLWGDAGFYYVANIGHLLGQNKHHFEYNIGFAVYEVAYGDYNYKYPSAYIGYRFQKKDGPFIFRTGFGWPEQLSLGVGVSF